MDADRVVPATAQQRLVTLEQRALIAFKLRVLVTKKFTPVHWVDCLFVAVRRPDWPTNAVAFKGVFELLAVAKLEPDSGSTRELDELRTNDDSNGVPRLRWIHTALGVGQTPAQIELLDALLPFDLKVFPDLGDIDGMWLDEEKVIELKTQAVRLLLCWLIYSRHLFTNYGGAR